MRRAQFFTVGAGELANSAAFTFMLNRSADQGAAPPLLISRRSRYFMNVPARDSLLACTSNRVLRLAPACDCSSSGLPDPMKRCSSRPSRPSRPRGPRAPGRLLTRSSSPLVHADHSFATPAGQIIAELAGSGEHLSNACLRDRRPVSVFHGGTDTSVTAFCGRPRRKAFPINRNDDSDSRPIVVSHFRDVGRRNVLIPRFGHLQGRRKVRP